ncbi:MAG: hypothetical protein ACJ8CR_36775 [Roseiflexaceae bacterium]
MNLQLLPLLQIQRDLHAIPRGWARFRAYLTTMTDGTDDVVLPITGMNPMGKEHVAALLDELLAAGAEAIAAAAIAVAAARLAHIPGDRDVALVVIDDAQGGWTNRYFTELAPQLKDATRSATRRALRWALVPIWTSEPWPAGAIRAAVLAAIYRSAFVEHAGFPKTLQASMTMEGLATVFAGAQQPLLDPEDLAYTAEVIRAYRDTRDYPTIFACLFGDEAARSVGYPPLGLSHRAGLALAHDEAHRQGVPPEAALQAASQAL